jgi:hypothetical protein|tara:strand:+ start:130 stop:327 length:198 start_codon:yes stop_codon:yes gene_type:complete
MTETYDAAQANLALMYKGEDNLKAHMWLNIASANGNEGAGTFRNRLEGKRHLKTSQKPLLWLVNA